MDSNASSLTLERKVLPMNRYKTFLTNNVALIGIIMVGLIGVLISNSFFTFDNMTNLLRAASIMGIVSVGMTFVILCGSIDLSVSSVLSLSGYFFIYYSQKSPVLSILVPLVVGIIVGLINAFIINKMKIPAFIGTLAMMIFCRGLTFQLTNEVSLALGDLPPALDYIANGQFVSAETSSLLSVVTFPLLLFVVIVVLTSILLKKRYSGRSMYIVGGNKEAAKLMGVSISKTIFTAHALSGFFAAIGGIIIASRLAVALPLAGTGYELYAIAAVVIGGAPLSGGVGRMSGTLYGAIIMAMFTNIFSMQSYLSPLWQSAVIGIILLLVVFIQALVSQKTEVKKRTKQRVQLNAL
jgi:ribose transport system permease protein